MLIAVFDQVSETTIKSCFRVTGGIGTLSWVAILVKIDFASF